MGDNLDRAVAEGDVAEAWHLAGRIGSVPLHQALSLTILLGRRADPRFEAAALRFVERFAAEVTPTLADISKVADALQTLRRVGDLPAMSEGAMRSLEDLGRQLRARR